MQEFITQFCDEKMADEVYQFVREKIPIKGCTRMLQQSIDYARFKSGWFMRDAEAIKRYLEKF